MKKVTVIYWSGTGNTEVMAAAVAEGARRAGANIKILEAGDASVADVVDADAVALGCPAIGAEVMKKEPFICSLKKGNLQGQNMALFGSCDWGNGEWMKDWENQMKKTGAYLMGKGLLVHFEPEADGLDKCLELGDRLAAVAE